jgi:hypothetical protein
MKPNDSDLEDALTSDDAHALTSALKAAGGASGDLSAGEHEALFAQAWSETKPEPLSESAQAQVSEWSEALRATQVAPAKEQLELIHEAAWLRAETEAFRQKRKARLRNAALLAPVLAVAAALLLVLRSGSGEPQKTDTQTVLIASRSSQTLFAEPFGEGNSSARVDRIASSRHRDFRENQFRKRGAH